MQAHSVNEGSASDPLADRGSIAGWILRTVSTLKIYSFSSFYDSSLYDPGFRPGRSIALIDSGDQSIEEVKLSAVRSTPLRLWNALHSVGCSHAHPDPSRFCEILDNEGLQRTRCLGMILIIPTQNHTTMKHFRSTLLLTVGLLTAPSFIAQSTTTSTTDATTYSKVDRVAEDLVTPAPRKMKNAFTRSVQLRSDGLYHVQAVSAAGVLRMEGSYLDSALTVAHGPFTYYHSNGRAESTGNFENGVKAGTWACWNASGAERASREYSGLAWDELQFVVGVADRAQVLGDVSEPQANLQ